MKALLFIAALLLGFSAQSQTDITPEVTAALSKGDAVKLGTYFAANVDLTLPGQEDVYAKDQASKLVGNFFTAHPAKSFTVKHRGTSKLNDHFRIGELSTSKGNFRVTFFMKKDGPKFVISQFRIEDADEE